MISEAVLDRAVDKGLITAGQALALRSLARQEEPAAAKPVPRDPEALRFVSGFADIFVTLGIVLFLGSAGYLLGRQTGPGETAGVIALLSWGLAEYFTRRKRMALPSIVLLLVFAVASFATLSALFGATGTARTRLGWVDVWLNFGGRNAGWGGAAAALVSAGLVGLHDWRFRVPVGVAAIVGLVALAALLALAALSPDITARFVDLLLLVVGGVAFALAMRFDLSDPARTTRRTDIAFWLHLLAAPLIVHSVFHAVGADRGLVNPLTASAVLAIFLGLGAVAVLVDRRALLVSGLVYAGAAFGSLLRHFAGDLGVLVPVTLLVLGAFVLALSAGWYPVRRLIVRRLPDAVALRLPNPTSLPTG